MLHGALVLAKTGSMSKRTPPRLYLDQMLLSGQQCGLSADQTRYLITVLRLGQGDAVIVFNNDDGEYGATIVEAEKKRATLVLGAMMRAPLPLSPLTLAFAPVRKQRLDMMLEKATEIGVGRFCPVITEFTQNPRLNFDRCCAITLEAAEQSERITAPHLDVPQPLDMFLKHNQNQQKILYCDEHLLAEPAVHLLAFLMSHDVHAHPIILIGPEGGFSDSERQFLLASNTVCPVSLGRTILRSETAAITALSLWQAVAQQARAT